MSCSSTEFHVIHFGFIRASVIPSGPILPPNVNLLVPPGANFHRHTTRSSSSRVSPAKPNPNFYKMRLEAFFSGNVNAKNSASRLRVLRDLDQMTRHFCGKAATLKFWKSEIRDLDSDAPRRRAKCARADYRVGRKPDIYPRRIGACCFVKVGRLVANISRGVVQQSRPPLSPLHFLPIRTKGRRERFKAESQIRGRESRSRLLAWGN